MKTNRTLIQTCLLCMAMLPAATQAQILVQDDFNGSGGALPDAAKYVWSGQLGQNGTGLLYLSTDAVDESWLRSIAGAAPGAVQTLDLQMRVYAYAENPAPWVPNGIYGDGQPRGLRVGTDINNCAEFYSTSPTSVGMRVRKNGVESGATYALSSGVDTLHDYEIAVTTTSAVFKVDGAVVRTFSNNIPTGALNVYVDSWDGGGVGNVPVALDSLSLSLTNSQVQGPPVITGFKPASGPNGTSVTISGTDFIGVTNVQFGGMTAQFTNNSTSLITAIVPEGAATGLITVVSTNGTVISSNNFVLTPMDFTYTTNAGTITITGYIGAGGAVTIPDTIYGLPVIGIGDVFFNDSSLISIIIGNNVTSIETGAFDFCINLTNVVIGNGVTTIGLDAFAACTNLTSVTMGNRVTTIGMYAFYQCSGLTRITIPNSVTNIAGQAFYYCTGLTNAMIGSGVTSIGYVAFLNCDSLTAITVDVSNSVYSSMDGVLFNKSRTTLIECPGGKTGDLAIADGVTSIGYGAFWECTSLNSVTIPGSLSTIGDEAFNNCRSTTSVFFRGDAPGSYGMWIFDGVPATIYHLPGTKGWPAVPTTWAGRPTALWTLPNPTMLNCTPNSGVQTNCFGFTICWATNISVVVEACTDLNCSDWNPVATNTLVDGTSYFSDPQWTNYPGRFYRLRSP